MKRSTPAWRRWPSSPEGGLRSDDVLVELRDVAPALFEALTGSDELEALPSLSLRLTSLEVPPVGASGLPDWAVLIVGTPSCLRHSDVTFGSMTPIYQTRSWPSTVPSGLSHWLT